MSSNGKLPKGWQRRRLDEVADIRFSSVDKNVFAEEVPVRLCNYMQVWKCPYIHKDLKFMEGSATPAEVQRFSVQPGDVLITKDSETKEEIAEPSLVKDKIDNLVLGYHLALIRPDPRQAHGAFLAAQLRIPEFRAQFVRAASGVTRYGLSLGAVSSAEVWLPSTDDQQRIGDILWSAHDSIEQTRAVIDQTRTLKIALLQDLLTHGLPGRHKKFQTIDGLGTFPATWSRVRLGEVVPFWQYGISEALADAGTMPCFRMNNVRNGKMVAVDMKYAMSPAENLTRYVLQVGDLLFNRTNSRDSVGRVGIFELASDFIFASYLVQMRVDKERVNSAFLNMLLNTNKVQAQIRLLATPGVSQSNINVENMKRFRVPLPDREEQDAIVRLVTAVELREVAESQKVKHMRHAKSALSQALLTGRVPVPTKGGE